MCLLGMFGVGGMRLGFPDPISDQNVYFPVPFSDLRRYPLGETFRICFENLGPEWNGISG